MVSPLHFLSKLWALKHALERASIYMETALGVTAQQRFVIRILGAVPTMTPGQLAKLLHIDPGSATAVLKRLEARKLVTRKPDPHDARRALLSLTPRGKRLDHPTRVSVEEAVNRALSESTASELAATVRVVQRLIAALDDVRESADDARGSG